MATWIRLGATSEVPQGQCRVYEASGRTIAVFKVLDQATGVVDTTDLTSDAGAANDNGNVFRHAGGGQYVFNLATGNLAAPATYRIVVSLDDGTQQTVTFSVRK